MPNCKKSSNIVACLMSEGYRHGEFVRCGWKLSLCDWMSSRVSVSVCVSIRMSVRRHRGRTQLFFFFPFLQEKLHTSCPPTTSCTPQKQKHTYVTTDVFTAESSLDVGVDVSSVTPLEMFDHLPFHSLGCWVKTIDLHCWTHSQLHHCRISTLVPTISPFCLKIHTGSD